MIVCLAAAPNPGDYYVHVCGRYIFVGKHAERAVDIYAKAFVVLNIKPSQEIAKLLDLLDILTFEVSMFSSRSRVNTLVTMIKELEESSCDEEDE